METKDTVCAVVVTFNRKDLLIECLESLENQTQKVDTILIVDNFSNDGTNNLLLEKKYIDILPPENISEPFTIETKKENQVIKYIKMNENSGGAGGFHMGIKTALEEEFDWVWLMDDDVEVDKNALSELLTYKELSKCIQPSRSILKNGIFYWDGYLDVETMHRVALFDSNFQGSKEYTYTNLGCFEGMLLHKDIIEKVGYPDKRFFIGYDDTMYGLKISRHTNILLTKKVLMNKKIDKKRYSSFSAYYFIRNLFLVKKILDEDYPKQKKKRNIFFKIELLLVLKSTFRDLKLFDAIKITKRAIADARNNRYFK